MSASIMDILQRVSLEGIPVSLQVVALTLVLGFIYSALTKDRPYSGIPLVTLPGKGAKGSFFYHGREIVALGMEKYSGPFQVMTGTGPKIVLPNRFADEIRNSPSLDFNKAFSKDFFVDYPGFEPHKQGLQDSSLIQETVRVKLTQSLNLVTDDLVDETSASLRDILGENKAWQTIELKPAVTDLVARLSARVFLGPDLCRNERWLTISKSYTIDSFAASYLMRLVPAALRPAAYWFIPQCAALRRAVADAHALIDPEVERRRAAVDAALAEGRRPPKVSDTIGWMHEVARGRPADYVAGQLSLTLAAIHTTTEITAQALLDVCEHPELADELRREAMQVLGEHGWAKTSLYKLKLMDSFLKESQRCTPLSMTSMNRYVEKDVALSDGTVLPAGSRILVLSNFMDPKIYPEPERFDASRFLKMRQQPGQENNWQFVTTTPDHILFGHGQHACPGRFFASNEVKIALCHLLLKYDWRFIQGAERPRPLQFETAVSVDPKAKIRVRRREEEINIG